MVAVPWHKLTGLRFGTGINETGKTSNPYIRLIRRIGDQIHRLELLSKDYGKSAFVGVNPCNFLVPKSICGFSLPDLFDWSNRNCNDKWFRSVRVITWDGAKWQQQVLREPPGGKLCHNGYVQDCGLINLIELSDRYLLQICVKETSQKDSVINMDTGGNVIIPCHHTMLTCWMLENVIRILPGQ